MFYIFGPILFFRTFENQLHLKRMANQAHANHSIMLRINKFINYTGKMFKIIIRLNFMLHRNAYAFEMKPTRWLQYNIRNMIQTHKKSFRLWVNNPLLDLHNAIIVYHKNIHNSRKNLQNLRKSLDKS